MPSTLAAKADLKTVLAKLVAMPTLTTETATCQAALDWVKAQVQGLPLHITDFVYDSHPALIMTTRPTKHPKVLLMAHLDVMPGPAEMFSLREEGGRYYGRGVFDMKFAVAGYLQLLFRLGADLPKYDFGVMLTTDEEPGGANTAAELVNRDWSASVVINPDAIADWGIEQAAKGYLRYRVHSQGQSGHGSRPWLYSNALMKLQDYLYELRAQFPAEPCGDPRHWHNTYSVNVLRGGQAYNQIPGEAMAEFEIRLAPGNKLTTFEALIGKLAEQHGDISLEPLAVAEATEIDPKNEYIRLYEQLVTKAIGRRPAFVFSHGASDSLYFIRRGIPAIASSPPGGGHHADDEWVEAAGVEQFAKIIHDFVVQTAVAGKDATHS